MTIKAQTTGSELQEAIATVIERAVLVPADTPEIAELSDQIDKLGHADHEHAIQMRALLMHITGDLDGALAVLDQCQGCDPLTRLVILSNYSKCTQARAFYSVHCRPETGRFTMTTPFAVAIGAFHMLASFARRAQKIGLSNLDKVDLEEIFMVDRMLSEFGISDEVTGDLMETAGAVLAEHGLLFIGQGPEVDVLDFPGELRAVHVTYHVPASAAVATDIYLEFIERLFAKEQSIPQGFHISFEGHTHAG